MSSIKKAAAATVLAAGLGVAGMAPAAAYTVTWIEDSYGGVWGTSCPPTVEHHGNGWETVRERRNQQIRGLGLGHLELPTCTLTGHIETQQWYEDFPMWY